MRTRCGEAGGRRAPELHYPARRGPPAQAQTGRAKGVTAGRKPCCACPETKKARDACIIEKGEENCGHLIEAHKECMRALGFKI
ncbi:cytochrome c oxidase copper chaperone [Columba livia]|uniref:Cytochrome c oxidase copper chaperone n=1 Tax=Columba livia TaxID=8932 RepID=A0A2I0MLD7_COLLI|nr:cytochrome c oxidase copper chaperone [Columba livia]PKK30497.1 cytochrome c oxidase copper chaperone [Columba livia]